MKCSKCGKEIANDSLFCEYCGTEIKKDNVNKESNTKRVDIRWALLPAMLIATFAMAIRWATESLSRFDLELMGFLAMILPTLLFLISLWNRIRNKVATSFVLIMSIFLLLNCVMLGEIFDATHSCRDYAHLSWVGYDESTDQRISHHIIVSNPFYSSYSEDNRNELRKNRQELVKSLEQVGFVVDDDSQIRSHNIFYAYNTTGKVVWGITSVLFVSYLIYVFVAYKKNWKF